MPTPIMTGPSDELEPPEKRVSRLQVVIVVLFATLCVSIGETLLSVGMKQLDKGSHQGAAIILAALTNRYVVGGTLLMMVYFGLYAMALSWAEISFVLPFTALSYLFVACFAHFFLKENVTATRWLGTLIIVLGVVVVGLGERGPKR
jgi:drug/metabolite transporter (DMT)-like permease